MTAPLPASAVSPVCDCLHGILVADPFRWLEDQNSSQTRAWLKEQADYAQSYLKSIPGRAQIRERVRTLLDVVTYDSIWRSGDRYFFRKRLPAQEQPCVYFREGIEGEDQLLIDPAACGRGCHTAIRPLLVSPDANILLYEIKNGGVRAGSFEFLDIKTRTVLPDVMPCGYLRGLAFAPDCRSFYYVHDALDSEKPPCCVVRHHILGSPFSDDAEVFSVCQDRRGALHLIPGQKKIGFLVYKFHENTCIDFYSWEIGERTNPQLLIQDAEYNFSPVLLEDDRVVAITNLDAPNLRIVELLEDGDGSPHLETLVPEHSSRIQGWMITRNRLFVSYLLEFTNYIEVFDLKGKLLDRLSEGTWETVRLTGASIREEDIFVERESFVRPKEIWRSSDTHFSPRLWMRTKVAFDSERYAYTQEWFAGKDGTRVPISLAGRKDILEHGPCPVVMTAYGGYGIAMTPRFSVLVALLMEHGCVFALPHIRGGSELGGTWHSAAKRRNRQIAFDDFLCGAEWLIDTGRADPGRLAIFGGSNSGLLVGAAVTQRPDLFRAAVCISPLLDMVRYHLFDNAHCWKDEFGTAEDREDFAALFEYSPYHRVHEKTSYPAILMVSGDADQNCNALHARKMVARLQHANISEHPIILDYGLFRGHSPVLPLSERIEALTARVAFLLDQLGIRDEVGGERDVLV